MRIVLKGIHKVKARLASGDVRIYYYAWRGGPQIKARPAPPNSFANTTKRMPA